MATRYSICILSAVALLLAACARPIVPDHVPEEQGSDALDGTAWLLEELHGEPPMPGTLITLQFEGGRAFGSDGCNRYTGSYSVDGDRLTVEQRMAATMMSCEAAIMRQADEYRGALERAAIHQIAEGRLLLLDEEGTPLATFREELQELAGTAWEVTAYNSGRQAVVSVLQDTSLTLNFDLDGRLSGSAGCNTFGAGFEASGGELRLSPVAATRRNCSEPPGIMEQEAQFLAALESAVSYRISGGRLELRDAGGSLAVTATWARENE